METYQVVTIVLSGISLICSLISFAYSVYNSLKINKFNMRNNYFDFFKDDITQKIPEFCSSFISKESCGINDSVGKQFEVYVNLLRKKIMFIEYIDKKRYKLLDDLLIQLEEEIILLPTRGNNKKEHINSFYDLVKDFYKEMCKHFS